MFLSEGPVVGSVNVGHIIVLIPDDLLVFVGEAAFGFGHHLARILRILDVDAAVVVVQVALRIAEVGLYVEVFMQFERGFERRGDLLGLLVAETLALLHHGVVAVHHVVGRGLRHRSMRHGRSVGIHRHERRQRMQRGLAEIVVLVLVAVILVVRLEEFGVAGDGQPRLDLGLQFHAEIVGPEHVGFEPVDALLLVVASADHVRERLGSALDVDVVIPRRAAVVVEVVIPVEVGQIDVLLTAVAPVGDDPRTRRILGLVVAPLPERLVIGFGVGGVGRVLSRHHEEVGNLGRVVAAGFVIGRGRGAGHGEITVVRHLGLFVVPPALGRNQNDAERAAGTVDRGRGGVFQHRDRLDVVRVDTVGIGFHTVDQNQRTASVGRSRTADVVRRAGSGLPRRESYVEVGNHALQGAAYVRHGTVFQLFLRHRGDGSGQVGFLLHAVTDHHHFVDALLGGSQDHVEKGPDADRRLVGVEPDERHFERGLVRKAERVESKGTARPGRGAPDRFAVFEQDGGTYDGITGSVRDLARNFAGGGNLRTAARRQDHLVPLDVYENVGNTFQHDPFDGPGLRSDGNDTGQVDVGVVIRERVLPLRLDLPQQFGDSDIFQMDRHGRVSGGNAPDGHKQKNE